jgi:hypothetical protein
LTVSFWRKTDERRTGLKPKLPKSVISFLVAHFVVHFQKTASTDPYILSNCQPTLQDESHYAWLYENNPADLSGLSAIGEAHFGQVEEECGDYGDREK